MLNNLQMILENSKVEATSEILPIVNTVLVAGSFLGNCADNIHWYVGRYSQGNWIYNSCSYCGKRQNV
jgi:hypothetical protein